MIKYNNKQTELRAKGKSDQASRTNIDISSGDTISVVDISSASTPVESK